MCKKNIFFLLLITTIIFSACSQEESKNQEANEMLASNEIVLTTTQNQQLIVKITDEGYMLDNSEGKVVIYDIFATWCPPCREGATHLTSLKEKFKNELIVIGVTIEEDISNKELENFKENYNAKYTIVNSPENRNLINKIATSLDLGQRFPIPIMALYKDGKLVNHYVGAVQEEFVESDIKLALGK